MFALKMRKGEIIVAGLNLKDFSFEIYAFVNGYLRYVPQVYIRIDNRTTVSVLKQYLVLIR